MSTPFEKLPGFFFKSQPGGPLMDRDGKPHDPGNAAIHLADVPFVPLRNRFADIHEMPGGFSGLVQKFSREMKRDAARPALVVVDHRQRTLTVDDVSLKLPSKMLAIVQFLLECHADGASPVDFTEAEERIALWLRAQGIDILPLGRNPSKIEARGITHDLSDLRTRLKKAGVSWTIPSGSPLPARCQHSVTVHRA